MIDGHGDDSYKYGAIKYNFSSNTKAGGMHPQLVAHLQEQIAQAESYPEPQAQTLARKIEHEKDLQEGSVLACNGAVEAFYLLAAWRKKCHSLILTPSFSEYEDACTMNDHRIDFLLNDKVDFESLDYPEMLWLCNPNNPDGKVYEASFLKEIISSHPDTLFVLDEAYDDFINRDISLEQCAPTQHNLVVVRSLTKRFSMPGLRLGYFVAHLDIVKEIAEKLIPWRINALAQQAGLFCFSQKCDDGFDLEPYLQQADEFKKGINSIDGFEVVKTETPYFLVKTPYNATELKEELAQKHQILIRDASNFRGLGENYIRLATQGKEANEALMKVLKEFYSSARSDSMVVSCEVVEKSAIGTTD